MAQENRFRMFPPNSSIADRVPVKDFILSGKKQNNDDNLGY